MTSAAPRDSAQPQPKMKHFGADSLHKNNEPSVADRQLRHRGSGFGITELNDADFIGNPRHLMGGYGNVGSFRDAR